MILHYSDEPFRIMPGEIAVFARTRSGSDKSFTRHDVDQPRRGESNRALDCRLAKALPRFMFYIPIAVGSTRRDRQTIKVARFVLARLQSLTGVQSELLDLLEYNFPIMEERLHRRDDPPSRLQEFGDKIGRADSVIIVTPEYNNGYPGVLKNALDYLLPEYERKPIGIVTVSAGGFGGLNCLAQLRLVTLGMGAFPIPASLPVSRVRDAFNEDGTPNDAAYEKRATEFLDEVVWFTEAIADRKAKLK
jgi:NAD(P)H-dependent FMN reductase